MARAMTSPRPDRSNRLFLVLAALSALAAAVLVFVALNSGGGDSEPAQAVSVDVVVAGEDIAAGTRISETMLKTAVVAPDQKLGGAYATASTVVGLVARYPISSGEQITLAKVGLAEDEQDGLSYVIPPGHRALAVSVTQVTSVGGLLLPKDRVDVIAVLSGNQTGDNVERAVTILQNVEVLSVDQESQELAPRPAEAEEGEAASEESQETPLGLRPKDSEPQPRATTITLALTPAQAQLLALIQKEGQVWLSARPFGEEETVDLGISTLIPLSTPEP